MTETPTPKTGRLPLILALVGVALIALAAVLYLNRRTLAREALTGWLKDRGVASEAEVEAFGISAFTARLRIGDPRLPDFTAARAHVTYRIRGLGFEVTSVTLSEPLLRATIRDGQLSVGSLDPLLEEFRKRPPRPDAAKPRIEIDDGVLLLATDYGPLRLTADALVEDGKLMSLDAGSDAARLRGPDFTGELGRATLRLVTRDDRVDARLDAPFTAFEAGGLRARSARLQVVADAPYPDLEKRRGDGKLVVRANLSGERFVVGEETLTDAAAAAAFTGETVGWIPDLRVDGQLAADVRAASGQLAGAQVRALHAAVTAPDLRWTRAGGDRVTGTLRLNGAADRFSAGDLRLEPVSAEFSGPATADREGGVDLALRGSAVGRGDWRGLGPVTSEDSVEMAALKRGLRSFRLAAPGVSARLRGSELTVALPEPLRIAPDRGGAIQVSARGNAPLIGPQGGAFRLTVSGGGLPQTEADVRRFELTPGGATALGAVKTQLSIGPVERGAFDAGGRLRIDSRGLSFSGDRCADVRIERLEFGENDAEDIAGRLCPTGDPLLELSGGDWRIAGRAEDMAARAPFLQARVAGADGRMVLGQRRGQLHSVIAVERARVVDETPEARFHPLAMTGRAELARDNWLADLDFRLPGGPHVAAARLRHHMMTGEGGVDIDTGPLLFAEGGLQPEQLSPMAQAVGSPATGEARFTGGFTWTLDTAASQGVLAIPRLDFQSPAGRVTGLQGDLAFTSLAPLVAAPGQTLHAESLDAIVPITDLTAVFGLKDDVVVVSAGQAAVGGGRVRVETLEIPLDPAQPMRGVLFFEGVQLHDVVEASPFGDHMELDAKVSGRVPFEARENRVRVLGGDLNAIEPGRLSISRAALTSVAAAGAVEGPPAAAEEVASTDTFTDFAYQAMENLAFNRLDAAINSRPDGRLSVLFRVVGRHDPPQRQEIRLSLLDLIQRNFLGRQLPLPSGTGVNLTLDTTLNLDDLLADYAEYLRLRSSPTVQP